MSNCGRTHHCCFFQGEVCPFLTGSPDPDYQYACSLRLQHGTWEAVHASAEYQEQVKPKMIAIGYPDNDCGEWPLAGMTCGDCGEVGK